MLDPINALSLAANVVQFVDYALRLVSKGHQIYRNAEGSTDDNVNLEKIALDLRHINGRLSTSLCECQNQPQDGILVPEDGGLQDISHACQTIASSLITKLDALKVKGSKNRRWTSFMKALETVWKKDEIDNLARTLKAYREQMDTHILISLRARYVSLEKQSTSQFKQLDGAAVAILDTLMSHDRLLDEKFEKQTQLLLEQFEQLLSSTKPILFSNDYEVSGSSQESSEPSSTPSTRQESNQSDVSLHEFAQSGDMRKLRQILRLPGINVDARNEIDQTPLHVAANAGQLAAVKHLWEKGASIDADDSEGSTPLHFASRNSHAHVVWFLLSKKADKLKANDDGEIALHTTSDELIKWILVNDLSLERCDERDHMTALARFARSGDFTAVALLLEYGADTETTGPLGATALIYASLHDHFEVTELLLSYGADIEAQAGDSHTSLIIAAMKGNEGIVKLLIERHANIEAKTAEQGHTALVAALWNGHFGVADILLRAGSSPNTVDKDGQQALNRAAVKGNVEMVSWLVDARANIDAGNRSRWTALHEASCQGHVKVVRLLLDRGAVTELRTDWGNTALLDAARYGHREVVRMLLDANANPNALNVRGQSPLAEASNRGFTYIVNMLLWHKGYPVYVDTRDNDNYTPLCRAAQCSHLEVIRSLLDHGANPVAQNKDGWTPLAEACSRGNREISKLLLEKGANTEISGFEGNTQSNDMYWTPLMRASIKGHLELVKILIDGHANASARTKNGRSVVALAREHGQEKVVKLLILNNAKD